MRALLEFSFSAFLRSPVAVIVFLLALTQVVSGCAVESVRDHASSQVEALDQKLTRNQSTKAEVLLFLGEPDGAGEALFPSTSEMREIWYYETHASSLMNATMKVLLVYFRDDLYDGYMWFENDAKISFE
jgi:hypothetical protein